MKDKLLYLTIGLLIGIVVMQSGNGGGVSASSEMSSMEPSSSPVLDSGGIIAVTGDGWWMLDEYGRAWTFQLVDGVTTCWLHISEFDSPIPVSQIKFWGRWTIVTTDNNFLIKTGVNYWHNCGPWPGGAVQTKPETWGGVKSRYDDKK